MISMEQRWFLQIDIIKTIAIKVVQFLILSWFKSVAYHQSHQGSFKNTGSQAPPWEVLTQGWDGPRNLFLGGSSRDSNEQQVGEPVV